MLWGPIYLKDDKLFIQIQELLASNSLQSPVCQCHVFVAKYIGIYNTSVKFCGELFYRYINITYATLISISITLTGNLHDSIKFPHDEFVFRAESHGYALYASCRNPMVNLFGRNFKATTTKICTHVDEHGVQRCIDFHKHRLMASYILKTIKLYISG